MRFRLLALLTTTAAAAFAPPCLAAEEPAPKGQGVVFFSLPKSQPGDSFVLEAVDGGLKTRFGVGELSKDGPRGAQGLLAAGDYRMVAWNKVVIKAFPTITVETGRLTDGGTLIAFPVGDRKLVVLPIRPEETAHDIDVVRVNYASKLSVAEPLRWQVDAPPVPADLPPAESPLGGVIPLLLAAWEADVNKATVHKRLVESRTVDAFFEIAKSTVPPLTMVAATDARGRALYGADLGQIRTRLASGEWGAIDTGTLHQVTVVVADGARLVAGYDDGSIRASDDQGAAWTLLATPAPGWRVTGLDHVGDNWLALVVHMQPSKVNVLFPPQVDAVRVLLAADADPKAFVALREFKYEEPPWVVPHAEHAGTTWYVNIFPVLWRLDVPTRAWSSLTAPGDVSDFHLGDGDTIAAWRAKGIFSKLFVTQDPGTAWKKLDHPSLQIADIRMFDAAHGVAIRSNPGAFTVDQEIYDYDAAHDDWRLATQAPQGCVRLLVDTTRHPRFCVTSGASILGWTDGKWVVESSTE